MNERIIKVGSYTDIDSLKMDILQKLNLVDHKKNCVTEFHSRLKNYINRSQSLKITFQLHRAQLEQDLRDKLSRPKFQQPFPENFEMGNPHNRWFYDPIIKTQEEAEREKVEFKKNYQDKLLALNHFFESLEQIGKGQILIKNN